MKLDIKILGGNIRVKWKKCVLVYAINVMPGAWPTPRRFRLDDVRLRLVEYTPNQYIRDSDESAPDFSQLMPLLIANLKLHIYLLGEGGGG